MKKLAAIGLFVFVLAAIFAAPVLAQGETPPADVILFVLPEALQGLYAVGIGFLVTQGMKALFAKTGRDLTGSAAMITAGLVTSAVALSNFGLSLVPAAYVEPTSIALMLVVSIFGVFGLHYSYAALKAKK